MKLNLLFRLRLAYWYLSTSRLNKKPSIVMHVYAFTHIGGLIFLFVFGAWTVLTILCGIQISTNIYPTIAFVGIIGAVLTYASCMYKKGYLKGKLHIEQKSMSKQDNICIWNGVLLLFVAIIPEVLALAYILIKLKAS